MRKRKKCPKWPVVVVALFLTALAAIIVTPLFYTFTPLQQARNDLKHAQESEAKGETMAAIGHYNDALRGYQKAGDKAAEEGVKLQIRYLESISTK